MPRKSARSGKSRNPVQSKASRKRSTPARGSKRSKAAPSARQGKSKPAKSKTRPRVTFTITHRVIQRLELDLVDLSAEDVESVRKAHHKPDICLNDESFPGEMTWCVAGSSATPLPGKRKALCLKRTVDFTFTCKRIGAMTAWEQRHVSLDDALLPSHVAGDFEGIFVGDQMLDYDTDYRGPCA